MLILRSVLEKGTLKERNDIDEEVLERKQREKEKRPE